MYNEQRQKYFYVENVITLCSNLNGVPQLSDEKLDTAICILKNINFDTQYGTTVSRSQIM